MRSQSRERNFINSLVDSIIAEADRCDVPPERVFGTLRIAFDNKQRCIDLARVQGADKFDLRQFYDPRVLANPAINCKCYSLGVWAGVVEPQKIIYSGNRTIVFWNDGTKTIVKVAKGQEFDEYLGFIAAYAKKMFGTNSKIKKLIEAISSRPEPKKAKKSDATEN